MVGIRATSTEMDVPVIQVVGAEQVGKHALVVRLTQGSSEDAPSTSPPIWHIRTKYYTAQAALLVSSLDDAGLDDRAPEAIVIVIDATRESTFAVVREWAGAGVGQQAPIVLLVANKMDRVGDESEGRPQWLDRASEWAGEQMVEYIEVAASDEDVDRTLKRWGEPQGLQRVEAALHAHMWPGMVMNADRGNLPGNSRCPADPERLECGEQVGGVDEGTPASREECTDAAVNSVVANGVGLATRKVGSDSCTQEVVSGQAFIEVDASTPVEGDESDLLEFEKLLEEVSGIRQRIQHLSDGERRDAAANVALRLARLLNEDSDGD